MTPGQDGRIAKLKKDQMLKHNISRDGNIVMKMKLKLYTRMQGLQ